MSQRQATRIKASEAAIKWMREAADPNVRAGPMPHLDFEIAIETILPCYYNPTHGNTESYSEDGEWHPNGGQMVLKGEAL